MINAEKKNSQSNILFQGASETSAVAIAVVTSPGALPKAPPVQANDDHVGTGAAGMSRAGDAAPANDNFAPVGPAPSGPRLQRPLSWTTDDPHAGAILLAIAEERTRATGSVLQTLDYLLSRARADGMVVGVNGSPSYRAISAASGVGTGQFNTGRPARLALDRWLPFFDVASSGGMRGERSPSRDLKERLTAYCDMLVETGAPMPAMPNGSQVSVMAVAEAIGASYEALTRSSEAKSILRDAVVARGVPLAPVPERRRRIAEITARIGELMAVVRSFDVPGGKVPESPHHVGVPDYERIAELTGKPGWSLRSNARYRKLVMEVVARRGTMPPGVMGRDDTFAALRTWGLEVVEREQKGKRSASWAAVVSNHRSALDRFVAALGLTGEDEAADAFSGGFEANLAKASLGVGTTASTANFVRLVKRWRELHLQRQAGLGLPERFGPALKQVLQLRGLSGSALAREVGCDHHVICDWCREKLGVTTSRVPLVGRIEAVLKLPAGTLLDKVGDLRVNYSVIEGASAEYLALDHKVRRLLPHGAAFWEKEQLEVAVGKVRPLLGAGTAHADLLRLSKEAGNLLSPFRPAPQLASQIDGFVHYKEVAVPYPLLRSSKAQWMSPASVDMGRRQISNFFRFGSTPRAEHSFSGLGVDPALATMAWFAVPSMVLAYAGRQATRFADMDWKGERRGVFYTEGEVDFLNLAVSLTNPVTGWLAQHPGLAETLKPIADTIPGRFQDLLQLYVRDGSKPVLSDGDVAAARSDWVGFCERSHRHFVQARERVGVVSRVSRSPYDSIAGLVHADEPIPEYLALLYAAERKWASEATHPSYYRIDVRDAAMGRLAPITGFRPKNLTGLVYTGDERGEIRKVDGVWGIEVCYRKFKNWKSCRLFSTKTAPKNFKMQLRDECGLYTVLDTWFLHARNYMVSEEGRNAAFVAKRGNPMTTDDYTEALKAFGMQHVAWNPVLETGFPGVTSINPYQVRHLRASDTLKRSKAVNRVEEAAFAIQTSEQMVVNHYGFLVPEQAILDGYDTFSEGALKAWKRLQG